MESGSPGVGFSFSEALTKLTSSEGTGSSEGTVGTGSTEGTGSSELTYNKENGMKDHDT